MMSALSMSASNLFIIWYQWLLLIFMLFPFGDNDLDELWTKFKSIPTHFFWWINVLINYLLIIENKKTIRIEVALLDNLHEAFTFTFPHIAWWWMNGKLNLVLKRSKLLKRNKKLLVTFVWWKLMLNVWYQHEWKTCLATKFVFVLIDSN